MHRSFGGSLHATGRYSKTAGGYGAMEADVNLSGASARRQLQPCSRLLQFGVQGLSTTYGLLNCTVSGEMLIRMWPDVQNSRNPRVLSTV